MADSPRETTEHDYWTEREGITCRTLVVRGEHGTVADDAAELMLVALPNATSATIPGAGHDLHLDQPNHWSDLLAGWLPTALP